MTAVKNFKSCYSVSKQLIATVKEFVGRNELLERGYWDGETFWGTRSAVDLVRAFCDGYFARCVETGSN